MDFFYRHTGKMFLVVFLVAGVATLFFAYDLQKALRKDHVHTPVVDSQTLEPDVPEAPTMGGKEHYELIAKRNIFEFPEGAPIESGSDDSAAQEAAETMLEVQLKGTVVSRGGYQLAMIEDWSERKEQLYSVGDSIQDAEIVEIRKDRVILQRAGKRETLSLFSERARERTRGSPPPPPEQSRLARPVATRQPGGASGEPSPSTAERERQQRVRSMMAQLRLRPHFQEGRPAGFIVGQVQDGSVFEEAGLRKGDIIVGVNDESVITPNQLLQAYRLVAEDEILWIDVIRDGREGNTIEIDLEEVIPGE